jgi:hypothetical protein
VDSQHDYQHRYGELACLAKFTRNPELRRAFQSASPVEAERMTKERFEEQKSRYYARWLEEEARGTGVGGNP